MACKQIPYSARKPLAGLMLASLLAFAGAASAAQAPPTDPEKIIIDTDIGTDVDDAFAIALALQSPEIRVLGISTASGDTRARARILDRMLGESGHSDIPVAIGAPTTLPFNLPPIGRQARFGEKSIRPGASYPSAVDFILGQIRQSPGEVTLVAIGPLTNVGQLIADHPDALRQLKRVVMMGGAFAPADLGGLGAASRPTPEYNILGDIPAAQALFRSGVPIVVMPLDSTAQLKLDEVKRDQLLSRGSPLTDALGILYLMSSRVTPVLYDAMAVGYVVDRGLCPTQPMHIVVDDQGVTRSGPGPANAQICLQSDPEKFFHFFMARFR